MANIGAQKNIQEKSLNRVIKEPNLSESDKYKTPITVNISAKKINIVF